MNESGKYFVSRQNYIFSPANERTVEITVGGAEHAGPDMLATSFADLGESHVFHDPRDALRAARHIALAWVAVDDEIEVSVYVWKPWKTLNHEGKSCIHIQNPGPDVRRTGKQLDEWAKAEYEKLVKCDQCRKIIDGDPFVLFDADDVFFCSPACAEDYQQENTEWAWCSRCDNDVEATHVLNTKRMLSTNNDPFHEDVEIFLCDHCAGAFELGQAYPKTLLEVL